MMNSTSMWRILVGLQLFIVACILAVNVCSNLVIDPYGFFKQPIKTTSDETNERFLKTSHLLNTAAYDVIIFGSSKIGVVKPSAIISETNIGTIYNYGIFGAKLHEIRKNIELLDKENKLPETALIALDINQFEKSWDQEFLKSTQRSMHPLATGESKLSFYTNALLKEGWSHLLKSLTSSPEKSISFNIAEGYFELHKDVVEKATYLNMGFTGFNNKAFADLVTIRDILSKNRINSVFIITPLRDSWYKRFTKNIRGTFRTKIEHIVDVHRDYLEHPMVSDKTVWLDNKHFKARVGERLIIDSLKPIVVAKDLEG